METDTVSVLNEIPCKECFNFMTIEVTTGNVNDFKFNKNKILLKHLQQSAYKEVTLEKVTVWYCKKNLLPNLVYFNEEYAYHLINVNCNCIDTDNV